MSLANDEFVSPLPADVHSARMASEYTTPVLEAMLGMAERDADAPDWIGRLREAVRISTAGDSTAAELVSKRYKFKPVQDGVRDA